ncbi:hypothetical protein KC850_02750 [Candidatus Kaiserbacteria bacterium]|nr:hypothetical protein [Candidatus Kaiserbacteria bacterium]
MSSKDKIFPVGSEWRRWDLHVHTKGTAKADAFKSKDFDTFCVDFFKRALKAEIGAIGVTDYFNIDNYKKVKKFVEDIDSNTNFNDEEKEKIKNIFLLPNVELRMFPVTDSGRLVNIHCIFNPDFDSKLDNHFFNKLQMSGGAGVSYSMNKQGLIDLGKELDSSLDDEGAYKKGLENFVVSHESLQKLLDTDKGLKDNVVIVVSNSNKDGASAMQKHFDLFDGKETSSLDGVRKFIYLISHAIFSSNEKDVEYFLGKGTDDAEAVVKKCGSLKPCVHGSDAHTEDKLFEPDKDRYCWIKADLTFDGLKQIIYEPEERVYIGLTPPVLTRVSSNKTKYIDKVYINQKPEYKSENGVWFKDVEIELNKELVSIIGNKGSGKSAIADVIGLVGNTHNAGEAHSNFSFLNRKKFVKKGYAENFESKLDWHDGNSTPAIPLSSLTDVSKRENVRYLPQNYFESLTNDLEESGFDTTLKSVTFSHLPPEQRLTTGSFEELEAKKLKNIEADLVKLLEQLNVISNEVVGLEAKSNPKYRQRIQSEIDEKKRELNQHLKDKPPVVPNPSDKKDEKEKTKAKEEQKKLSDLNDDLGKVNTEVSQNQTKLNGLTVEKEDLTNIKEELERLKDEVESYVSENKARYKKYNLKIEDVVKSDINLGLIDSKITEKAKEIQKVQVLLMSEKDIGASSLFKTEAERKKAKEESLIVKKVSLEVQIEDIKKLLSKPEREYQNYKEKLTVWENIKSLLEGNEKQIGSLKNLEAQLGFIDKTLPTELENKRKKHLEKSLEIFNKKKEIVDLYNLLKESVDAEIKKDDEFNSKFRMEIEAGFRLDNDFPKKFLSYINRSKVGTYCRADERMVKDLFADKNLLDEKVIADILKEVIENLETDKREEIKEDKDRIISEQVSNPQEFYDFLFSLEYLSPIYELKLDGKTLEELSPGEKGALLLVFYLMIDKEDIPLIIDQPEDNLDNKSVFEVLTHFIKAAKKRRQIIIVTHNPNLAVGADAEQIIYVDIDKKNKYKFSYELGSIENPSINRRIVEILEGTMPAFDKRKLKYHQK